MAITVIATPGAANANSFQTVAEIDQYYQGRVPASVRDEWLDADDEDKAAGAVMATIQMTSLICWNGWATSADQSLPWPRNGMMMRSGLAYVDMNVIPMEVKIAHAELARLLIKSDRLEESDAVNQGLTRLKAGPITLDFKEDKYHTPVIPQAIIDYLVPDWIDEVYSGPTINRELRRA